MLVQTSRLRFTHMLEDDDDLPSILAIWDILQQQCVDPRLHHVSDIWSFSSDVCLYFTTIRRKADKPKISYSSLALARSQLGPALTLDPFWEAEYANFGGVAAPSSSRQQQQQQQQNAGTTTTTNPDHEPVIGCMYLCQTHLIGTMSLGIVLLPPYRALGLGPEAISALLGYAFQEMQIHRVQAYVVAGDGKERALRTFMSLGFQHEGTQRRAVLMPAPRSGAEVTLASGATAVLPPRDEYKDVTTLALLDTDYTLGRLRFFKAPQTLWDELLRRHDREREELLRWEASAAAAYPHADYADHAPAGPDDTSSVIAPSDAWNPLQRTPSRETLRVSSSDDEAANNPATTAAAPPAECPFDTDDELELEEGVIVPYSVETPPPASPSPSASDAPNSPFSRSLSPASLVYDSDASAGSQWEILSSNSTRHRT